MKKQAANQHSLNPNIRNSSFQISSFESPSNPKHKSKRFSQFGTKINQNPSIFKNIINNFTEDKSNYLKTSLQYVNSPTHKLL